MIYEWDDERAPLYDPNDPDDRGNPDDRGDPDEGNDRVDPDEVRVPWGMIVAGCFLVVIVVLAVANTRSEEERRELLAKFAQALKIAQGDRRPYG